MLLILLGPRSGYATAVQGVIDHGSPSTWFEQIPPFLLSQGRTLRQHQQELKQANQTIEQLRTDCAALQRDHKLLSDVEQSLQQQLKMVREQQPTGPREVVAWATASHLLRYCILV